MESVGWLKICSYKNHWHPLEPLVVRWYRDVLSTYPLKDFTSKKSILNSPPIVVKFAKVIDPGLKSLRKSGTSSLFSKWPAMNFVAPMGLDPDPLPHSKRKFKLRSPRTSRNNKMPRWTKCRAVTSTWLIVFNTDVLYGHNSVGLLYMFTWSITTRLSPWKLIPIEYIPSQAGSASTLTSSRKWEFSTSLFQTECKRDKA